MAGAIVVAVVIGVGIAVQVAVLGRSAKTWHPLSVSLALQAAGLVAGIVWAFSQRAWSEVWQVTGQWWWLLLGAVGWGIVGALGLASARLGVSVTLVLVVSSQLVTGLVLDQVMGAFAIGVRHVLGVVLLVAGLLLVTK